MIVRLVTILANMMSTNQPWWLGAPTKLLNKTAVVKEGPGRLPVYTLTFSIPSNETFGGRAKPHSSLHIALGDVVKIVVPGYKPKSFSMSAIRDDEFDITFKVYPNGRASGYLDRLKVGETTGTFGMSAGRIRNPGTFVGIVAYGVGITEGLPVARAELENNDAKKVVLLWASRTFDSTFWHEEIHDLSKKYPERFQINHILSREEKENCLHGRINPDILNQVFQPNDREQARFLSVGTKEMMNMTTTMLSQIGYEMPQNDLLPKLN